MFSLFRKKDNNRSYQLNIDLHSHLIPGIDDGVATYDEALTIIEGFKNLGYKKLITTPHIMSDFYNNSPSVIKTKAKKLNELVQQKGWNIEIIPSAEYYLDDELLNNIKDTSHEILTFGKGYMLFETSFMNKPFYIDEFIFEVQSRGITPIMAHPERYAYIFDNIDLIEDYVERGVKMQLNINSLSGYYSKDIKKVAEKLIKKELIHFLGSDCHNMKHFNAFCNTIDKKNYQKALQLPLLNHTL